MNQFDNELRRVRSSIVETACANGDGHLSSSLSCVEILWAAATYLESSTKKLPWWESLILSKGHGVLALYAIFSAKGLLNPGELSTFNLPGSRLGNHPNSRLLPYISYSSGSLGHGLGFAAGIAFADKLKNRRDSGSSNSTTLDPVIAVLGDGECQEGSVWEACRFASAKELDNLTLVVDHNKIQCVAPFDEVSGYGSLLLQFQSFGWSASEVDGHSIEEITSELLKDNVDEPPKPRAIVAQTIGGKGVSFMEGDVAWHYKRPTSEETARALGELAGSAR